MRAYSKGLTGFSSAALSVACALAGCAAPVENRTLTVLTTDSFAVSEDVVRRFEEQNGVEVVFLKGGDAGTALNRAILTKTSPVADVLFGVDNTFLGRALAESVFAEYRPAGLEQVPQEYQLDPSGRATPVDYGAVCLNYDPAWFVDREIQVPNSLEDLMDPAYRGLLVVENPATSSTGLAFLMATVARFGEQGYLGYWASLRENDVLVADGWDTAYYTHFSGSAGRGPRPLVVSYSTSPVAEMMFAEPPLDSPPTGAIVAPGTCFLQIEFAGILAGAKNRPLAERFVDFLLSREFQEDLPIQNLMYPVLPDAVLPESFVAFGGIPDAPLSLPPGKIAEGRDLWIRGWTTAVLE